MQNDRVKHQVGIKYEHWICTNCHYSWAWRVGEPITKATNRRKVYKAGKLITIGRQTGFCYCGTRLGWINKHGELKDKKEEVAYKPLDMTNFRRG